MIVFASCLQAPFFRHANVVVFKVAYVVRQHQWFKFACMEKGVFSQCQPSRALMAKHFNEPRKKDQCWVDLHNSF